MLLQATNALLYAYHSLNIYKHYQIFCVQCHGADSFHSCSTECLFYHVCEHGSCRCRLYMQRHCCAQGHNTRDILVTSSNNQQDAT